MAWSTLPSCPSVHPAHTHPHTDLSTNAQSNIESHMKTMQMSYSQLVPALPLVPLPFSHLPATSAEDGTLTTHLPPPSRTPHHLGGGTETPR